MEGLMVNEIGTLSGIKERLEAYRKLGMDNSLILSMIKDDLSNYYNSRAGQAYLRQSYHRNVSVSVVVDTIMQGVALMLGSMGDDDESNTTTEATL
jgi:hypothetical protein